MIPRDYVTAWRARAPWVQDAQVEQDLVLSRALVEIFSHPERVIAAFQQYMDHGNHHVTRALFEQNLAAKLRTIPSSLTSSSG